MVSDRRFSSRLSLGIKLLLGLVVMINLRVMTQPQLVTADDRCGPGYECWDSNGGTASVYGNCQAYGGGAYCGGTSSELYCDCTGSADCTCQLGPGTDCSYGTPTLETEAYCLCSEDDSRTCDPTAADSCGAYGTCDHECEDAKYSCPPPRGTSIIGCCYGEPEDPW